MYTTRSGRLSRAPTRFGDDDNATAAAAAQDDAGKSTQMADIVKTEQEAELSEITRATSCSSRRSLRSIDELDAEAERIAAEELAEVERKLIRKKLELQKKLNRNRSSGSSNASVRSSSSRRSRETGNGSELTCADRISLAERAQRAERAERNMGAALEEANGQIQDLLLDHQVQGEQASGNEPNGTRPTPTSARQSHPMNLTTHHFMARQSTAKDLPQFSGHADEWPAFIFALEHTTRECGFLNGENLGRLQKALRGKAKEAVQGMMTLPDNVRNGDTAADTYALLDEGSTVSLIESELAEELGLAGPTRPLRLSWTDGKQHQESSSKVVTFSVAGRQRQESFTLTNVHTHAKFNLPTQSINPQRLKNCPHLEGLELPTLSCAKPRLLIGQDNYSLIAPRVIGEGPPNAPVATQTKLGWVVHGKTIAGRCRIDEGVVLSTWGLDSDLHDLVQQSFALDSLGVKPAKIRSKADDRALQLLDTLTTRTGRRWQTGLLWREDNITLPRSKATAAQCLEQLERRLRKDDTLAQGYQSKIDSYLEQGYARKLSPEEATHQPERTWYLPHFAVYNKEKGKVRLVFDAAAKSHGKSLNDFLLTGPDLLTPITQVLYNFRLYEVAFGADIKEMFHQVKMRPEDRHAQRFLWRDMDASRPADVYQMDVMTFGAVCSPTAAQFAKNINAHDLASGDARTVTAIEECHYVDDYFDSTPTTEEAVALTRKVMDVHEGGGFVIRNWVSNSPTVLESLPSDLRSPRIVNVHSHDHPIEKTLGLRWDPAKDTLGFSCGTKPDPKAPVTKRSVLRHTMSVFDPLGLVSCHSIIARMLLQDVWRAGIGWDDELPASLALRWTDWAAELDQVATVEVPRCSTPLIAVATDIQLHVFADASEKAYGAAAYLRVANHGTQLAVSLVAAKARVAPLKPASIPRLELQAAVLASRLSCTVREQLRISIPRVIFWTDSRTVLLWIRSDARQFKPFVAHRIAEITDTTEVDQWHWVPTRLNPADDLSRGISAQRLQPDDRWFGGPDYLRQGEADWPAEETHTPDPDDLELKRAFSGVQAAAGDSSEPPSLKAALPEIERFSSWCRLVRATAWVLRFTRHLRHGGRDTAKPSLTVPELRAAESLWWKAAQAEGFPEELAALRNGKPVNKDSRLVQMTPFIDDNGIMRSDSRVRNAKVENKNLRQPVLLPPKHAFTRLLIQQHHVWSLHQGQDRVVNELRQKYWVPGIRTAVRSTWSECQHCKNLRAKPQPPIMSALPECRTDAFQRPFTRTGLDYFGPLSVTVGRRHEKRYGALFTCLATRAVHVELAHDLSTDSTLMAIRRFISRRGCPLVIHSDNGTNFKGAAKELRQAIRELNEARIQDQISHDGITWSFNPPAAPHMGGAWERLVGSIKTALHAILKECHPKEETLLTALAEAEALVNSRPLTHVSLDAADDEALTPNHFLIGSSCAILQGIAQAGDVSLRRQWRVAQALADMFWRRWVREYLPTLAHRTKWNRQTKQLVVNDIVIIADDNAPRGSWLKGVVSAVHPGRDGVVRVVDVKTASGSVFRRPAAKICDLTKTVQKTTFLAVGPSVIRADIVVPGSAGDVIGVVSEFTYLGSTISDDAELDAKVTTRLAKASRAFGSLLQPIFRNSGLWLGIRRHVYQAVILSVLLYGSETWTLKAPLLRRLDTFHRQCVRTILSVTRDQQWQEHLSSEDLAKRSSMPASLEESIRANRLRWFGHLARMDDTRLPKQILFAEGTNTRPRHGPKRPWRDVVTSDLRATGIPEA
ncbi:uncharacterized protein LOC135824232 [Sycon ciliatum]|uniref:uncharacterized protein LOC135824232 n=1 Tax=Sycon ciliatum TaxID=27933 RepID=UPI0031F65E8E